MKQKTFLSLALLVVSASSLFSSYDVASPDGFNADLVIADESDETEVSDNAETSTSDQTRGTKKFDNIVVRGQASVGSLFVGGDEIVNGNRRTNGSETITGNETILGNLLLPNSTSRVGVGTSLPITQLDVTGYAQPQRIATMQIGEAENGRGDYAVYVQGRYAYVAEARTAGSVDRYLRIIDVSEPANPYIVSTTSFGSNPASNIYVQGHYAYTIMYQTNTLRIYDVKNPAAPVLVSTTATGTTPFGLYVQGRYAYVTNGSSNTLQVFDVSNPTLPVLVGSANTGSFPINLNVQGSYAYVVNLAGDTLQIFDVSNPANPSLVNTTPTDVFPAAVQLQGRYAYVANTYENSSKENGSLQIFDISNPALPVLVSRTSTGAGNYPAYLAVQARYAYIANGSNNDTPPVYATPQGNNLQVFDVSNPAAPVDVSSGGASTVAGNGPENLINFTFWVAIQGRYAFVTYATATSFTTPTNFFEVFDLGGAYIQQLEVGGMEAATIQTRENATINNDLDVRGGATFGRGFESTNSSSIISTGTTTLTLIQTNTAIGVALNMQGVNNSAASANLVIDVNGNVYRSISSKRYKQNIQPLQTSSALYALEPVHYDTTLPHETMRNVPGFIAEQVYAATQNPSLVTFNKQGEVEGINYNCLHALEVNEIQKHQHMLEAVLERIAALEAASQKSH